MDFTSALHHRHTIRLRDYDYSQAGAYFVTICTQDRTCLFGDVADGKMILNVAGKIVWDEWHHTATLRPLVRLDEFVVMPNHVHGILWFTERAGAYRCTPPPMPQIDGAHGNAPLRRMPGSLGSLVAGLKSITTKRINEIRNTPRHPVWQRNYHERIVRDAIELNRLQKYIAENPTKWVGDENNIAGSHLAPQ